MNKDVKSILLECLNENIRIEEMIYTQNIFEATVGDTSDTGFDFTKSGKGVCGPAPTDTGFDTSKAGKGVCGPAPIDTGFDTSKTPVGSPYPTSPVTPGTGGWAPGGIGFAKPWPITGPGTTGTGPKGSGKTGTGPAKTPTKTPSMGGGRGSGMGGGGTNPMPTGTDILQALGLVGPLSIGGFMAKLTSKIPVGLYGKNWVERNIANILPKQEALRKEGLGYTKGWAALADTK